ncbi:RagB/SusD family nutrient uptake outer membrane protein [Fulvivirgaceae bacterium BMA10]|uniref:RagB/SusD family nutrient uptake outer membrane protein n=1 Tax=Splendidivirga corallicola TaxID=3051826 RepID=A0ABT8KNB6_9BACT|nr:RagB/SusD family nutrient uptake outer membrane protein [Fulvivirgaceae bacterium BMA10]
MKKIIKISIISLALLAGHGCDDVLDVENVSALDPVAVWSDETLTNAFLARLYQITMPGAWPLDAGNSDEGYGLLAANAITANGHPFATFGGYYSDIRQLNTLFTEIDGGTLEEDFKNEIKGQAHFLRAWTYFNLVVRYGGVPIIKNVQNLEDDLQVSRNSTGETFDFIIEDLDNAISLLDGFQGSKGRINEAIALAFKGRVLLYKASPQFNPSNPFDNQYWSQALTATETAMNELAQMGYALESNYANIWSNENTSEAVMPVIFSDPDRLNGRRENCVRPLSISKNCTGGDVPVWNFVESYPMADGYQPGDVNSAYTYDMATYWENRDPRFYATVLYNASIAEFEGVAGRRIYLEESVGDPVDVFAPGVQIGDAKTGFYCLKGLEIDLSQAEVETNDVDWIEIRYAEVLLNFAEAANENGRGAEAIQVLRDIRQRAGIEPGAGNTYGIASGMSRDAIRDAIYHERYIELAFEGKRFWDLRRARRLHTQLDGLRKTGLLPDLKAGANPADAATFSLIPTDFDYSIEDIVTGVEPVMVTPESYYFFPITQNHLDENPNLEQNADWGGTFDPTL